VVVATRLHAAVLAYLAGGRVLSMVYHPKIPAVFETVAPDGAERLALLAPTEAAALPETLARVMAADPGGSEGVESMDRARYRAALLDLSEDAA
jgi:polysaccharide pyruvyl transferase WcaK-like protein